MRAHPGVPLHLSDMAMLAGVSRSHFDRLFRSVTALSPRQFQTAIRLHAATRLLLTTARSVIDICFEVGYESLGSFVTKFIDTFGLPPQRLRTSAASLYRLRSPWPRADILANLSLPPEPLFIRGEIVGGDLNNE